MKLNGRVLFAAATLFVAVGAPGSPARAETYAKNFELQTLDHRYAAALVIDLCKSLHQRPADCKVQVMNRGMISVYASPEVHAEIVRMLAKEDPLVQALGFRVILVRPGDAGSSRATTPPDIRRALAAVEELLGLSSTTIDDTGLIRTADSGSTRFAASRGESYDVELEIRDIVTRREGREVTVALELADAAGQRNASRLLSSVVTLRVGETIVAGTSRPRPEDRPLIVLLTALPAHPEE